MTPFSCDVFEDFSPMVSWKVWGCVPVVTVVLVSLLSTGFSGCGLPFGF